MFDLDVEERDYLLELLQNAHTNLLHEIHHSRTRRFEDALRHTVALNERVTGKLAEDRRSAEALDRMATTVQ